MPSAADLVRQMNELRETKPRPIAKLYGAAGPTPEQQATWNQQNREHNSKMADLKKQHARQLAIDNEAFYRHQKGDVTIPD